MGPQKQVAAQVHTTQFQLALANEQLASYWITDPSLELFPYVLLSDELLEMHYCTWCWPFPSLEATDKVQINSALAHPI